MARFANRPTPFFQWLLKRFCREALYDELAGDLEESFFHNAKIYGVRKARRIYNREVIMMMRPSVVRILNHPLNDIMIVNNIKMAFRHIQRDKQHAAIAVFGLSIGLMASFLILQYVHFESSFENFHEKENQEVYRVSRVNISIETGEVQRQNADNFLALKDAILDEVPDVITGTRVSGMFFNCGYKGQVYENESAYFTDAAFFEVFNFKLLAGEASKLDEPNHIMFSESFAKTVFGQENPLGKTVTYYFDDIRASLVVAGIFEDPPNNTHIQAHVLASMDRVIQDALIAQWFGNLTYEQFKWRWSNFHTYVTVDRVSKRQDLKEQIDNVIKRHRGDRDLQAGRTNSVILHALDELHFVQGFRNQLGTTANLQVLRILEISAVLILVLAWINYINLTSARSIRRAKETGVRKVLGAFRTQLIHQFLVETIVVNLLAGALAWLWTLLLAPVFEETTGLNLMHEVRITSLIPFVLMILIGIVVSGVYPSLLLSRFKPTQILRGKFSATKQGKAIRGGLMLIQFTVVLILLSGVFVIQSQLNYMTRYDIGMETESVVTISSPPGFMRDSTFHSRFEALSQEVKQIPAIQDMTSTTLVSGENNWGGQSAALQNDSDRGTVFMFFNTVDEDFVDFHDLELVAGRNLSKSFTSDENAAMINEMVAQGYGLSPQEIIGKTLLFQGGIPPRKVVGVIKNFYPMGVKYTIEPMLFSLSGTDERYYLNLKLAGMGNFDIIKQLENIYGDFFPGTPFQIEFAEQRFKEIFESDKRVEVLLKFFSFVAIIIAGLGIVGLTSFLINQKMKEVSIRKVLGASFADITSRFSKEYLILVAGAGIVGIPVAVYFTKNWLDNYELRVSLSPLHFIYPLVILLVIITVIISLKTFKAATANPSHVLRNE